MINKLQLKQIEKEVSPMLPRYLLKLSYHGGSNSKRMPHQFVRPVIASLWHKASIFPSGDAFRPILPTTKRINIHAWLKFNIKRARSPRHFIPQVKSSREKKIYHHSKQVKSFRQDISNQYALSAKTHISNDFKKIMSLYRMQGLSRSPLNNIDKLDDKAGHKGVDKSGLGLHGFLDNKCQFDTKFYCQSSQSSQGPGTRYQNHFAPIRRAGDINSMAISTLNSQVKQGSSPLIRENRELSVKQGESPLISQKGGVLVKKNVVKKSANLAAGSSDLHHLSVLQFASGEKNARQQELSLQRLLQADTNLKHSSQMADNKELTGEIKLLISELASQQQNQASVITDAMQNLQQVMAQSQHQHYSQQLAKKHHHYHRTSYFD